jgi:monomeric sarcosine oxidase
MHANKTEIAVVGLGAAGSAALNGLARAGVKAVGIDQFAPPHSYGSSHGDLRLLRVAYAEGAGYVPMARRAIALWQGLEKRSRARLFHQTGARYGGPPGSPFLEQARRSVGQSQGALAPGAAPLCRDFVLPAGWQTFDDAEAGYLECEKSIETLLRDAEAHGAVVEPNRGCTGIQATASGVTIRTEDGDIQAGKAIIACGAWIAKMVPALAAVSHIERRVMHWFADPQQRYSQQAGFAPFLIETETGEQFYGFPTNAKNEMRLADHRSGDIVPTPAALDRRVSDRDRGLIQPLADRFLPGLGALLRSQVCMYPMSRDGHFIIDRLPGAPRLVIGAGLSGHGFKFAPVIGEALANLAMDAGQKIDLAPFAFSRFK